MAFVSGRAERIRPDLRVLYPFIHSTPATLILHLTLCESDSDGGETSCTSRRCFSAFWIAPQLLILKSQLLLKRPLTDCPRAVRMLTHAAVPSAFNRALWRRVSILPDVAASANIVVPRILFTYGIRHTNVSNADSERVCPHLLSLSGRRRSLSFPESVCLRFWAPPFFVGFICRAVAV